MPTANSAFATRSAPRTTRAWSSWPVRSSSTASAYFSDRQLGLGLLAGCATLPIGPRRQARLPRVGYLASGGGQERADGFRQGLADHGYAEGPNIAVEWRDSEGRADRLPGLAAELVGLPVDVLVADGPSATRALTDATRTIPI